MSDDGSTSNGGTPNNSAGEDRQFVHFSFYKLDPAWRRLPEAEQASSRAELAATIEAYGERFALRSYTVAGLRPDADFMLWKVSERLEDFQEIGTAIMSTAIGSCWSSTVA